MAEDTKQQILFYDDPKAPQIYATEVTGYSAHEGALTITLEINNVDHIEVPGTVRRVVVGRLMMQIPAAQRLVLSLYDFLKQNGLDPAELVTRGETPQ